MPTIPDQSTRHTAATPAAVRLAADQLEALALAEEAAAQDAAAALGYWQFSDEAATHAEAALVLHRRARELYATLAAPAAVPAQGGVR
jgi:hypothetical protein